MSGLRIINGESPNDAIIDSFIEWVRVSKRKATALSYYDSLRRFRKWLAANDAKILMLTVPDLTAYVSHVKSAGLRGGTVGAYVCAVRSMWSWLREQGLVSINEKMIPVPEVISVRKPHVTSVEWRLLLSVYDEAFPRDLRNKLAMMLLFVTGLRLGELLAINVEDLNLEQRSVRVKTFKRKNHWREVFWTSEVHKVMVGWLEYRHKYMLRRGSKSDALFISMASSTATDRMGRAEIQRCIRVARQKAGIAKQVTPHSFRHGHATFAIENGMSIHEVQQSMGHAKMGTTAIYLHADNKNIREKTQSIFSSID